MGLRHFPHGLDASGSKGTAFNNATLPGTNSWFLEFMLDFRIGNQDQVGDSLIICLLGEKLLERNIPVE